MFCAVSASGQTENGRFTIGGSADISEAIQYKLTDFNLSLAPSIGIFAIKNLVIGGHYSFTIGSTNNYNNATHTTSKLTTFVSDVGPLLKYYLGKKALKGVASFNAGYVVYTAIESGSLGNYNGFQVEGSLGMAYFFNPYISLEMAYYISAAGYQKILPETQTGLSLGVYTFLDKKKKE
jgi:hypothetical protein